jgi:hypothetical protein
MCRCCCVARAALGGMVLFCTVASVCAQSTMTAVGDKPLPVVTLSAMPQAEPDPPLKYTLVPAYMDVQPGNAATSYYRAIALLPRDEKSQFGDVQSTWLEVPLSEFPKEEARAWLAAFHNTLEEVRIGTLRETCDWNHRIRELKGMETFAFLLPELQEARVIARVLRVKSRLEIVEGNYDQALSTMTMGYRLAENAATSPTLISDLVGIAIAQMMNASVQDWIASGGPNLYWALASLPNPLVDMRAALDQEMHLPLKVFPFLQDPETAVHTPEQWRQIIAESVQQLAQLSDSGNTSSNWLAQTAATAMIMTGYSAAKRELIDSGMGPATVDAMPVGQVVAIQSARAYRKVYQESMKWTLLPYWQSYRQMRATFAELRGKGLFGKPGEMPAVIPIASLLLPAIEHATFAPVRLQREIGALQTLEALRMAAAASNGQLPQTLEQLEACPAPVDPVTGRPFDYRVENGVAILILAPPDGRSAEEAGKRFELRLASPAPQ